MVDVLVCMNLYVSMYIYMYMRDRLASNEKWKSTKTTKTVHSLPRACGLRKPMAMDMQLQIMSYERISIAYNEVYTT